MRAPLVIERVWKCVQNAEVSDRNPDAVALESYPKGSSGLPTRDFVATLDLDCLLQPPSRTFQNDAVARRKVARPLVVEILRGPANLDGNSVTALDSVEMNPQRIRLCCEQIGAWAEEARAPLTSVLGLGTNPVAPSSRRRPERFRSTRPSAENYFRFSVSQVFLRHGWVPANSLTVLRFWHDASPRPLGQHDWVPEFSQVKSGSEQSLEICEVDRRNH
jgi:hypothetical protein